MKSSNLACNSVAEAVFDGLCKSGVNCCISWLSDAMPSRAGSDKLKFRTSAAASMEMPMPPGQPIRFGKRESAGSSIGCLIGVLNAPSQVQVKINHYRRGAAAQFVVGQIDILENGTFRQGSSEVA